MMLSDQRIHEILELQKKYPEKRSALIPALHLAQDEIGYLPSEIQEEVAKLFEITISEVNSIVTFYDMFHEKPMGKHVVHFCKNISCMLRGSDEIYQRICERLKLKNKLTTEDGKYSLIPSECLGACDKAPMLIFDEEVIGPLTENELNKLFDVTP